jgi:hypothetical protein
VILPRGRHVEVLAEDLVLLGLQSEIGRCGWRRRRDV